MGRKGVSKRKPQSKVKQISGVDATGSGKSAISQLVKSTDTGQAIAATARSEDKGASHDKKKAKKR